MVDLLADDAAARGLPLEADQIARFGRYLALLTERSERVNLIARAAPETIVRRHLIEAVALGVALRERELLRPDASVLDLGAGAGLPGIPLKIAWPALRLTLLDATAKKAAFMREACDALGLDDVRVLSGRAETLAHDPELRGRFDLVVARAVAPLRVLAELALPFARVGGRVVTPKGSRAAEEVAAARGAFAALGARVVTLPFAVPGPPQTLVILVQQRPTPDVYPRRDGVPARTPL